MFRFHRIELIPRNSTPLWLFRFPIRTDRNTSAAERSMLACRTRFMLIVKASAESEAGVMPKEELIAEMTRFNEEMQKAGVLLDLSGLQPSSKGARVKFSGGERIVTDGPFTEAKELIAGYWMFQVKSKEEAIEWVKRCPNPLDGEAEIEIRQVFEVEDFPNVPDDVREMEQKLRAGHAK